MKLGVNPEPGRAKTAGRILTMGILLCLAMIGSLRFGSTYMAGEQFWNGLLGVEGYETQSLILHAIRLPRLLAGILAGIGLSVSGVLLQSVTGNELASPNLIGVNSGAGFLVIVTLSFFPAAIYLLPFTAFIGAFFTTLLIVSIANRLGSGRATVILAGIACTAVLNAGISFLSLLDTDVLVSYHDFSVGGLASVTMQQLWVPAGIILLGLAAALVLSGQMDLLCLGDSMALSLGVRVKPLRMVCLVLASATAAAVVSFAGLLGFVGLMVPHIARKLTSHRIRCQLVSSALVGSILVLTADLAGRLIFAPSELPVGIVMALLGAPFFLVLLLRRRVQSC